MSSKPKNHGGIRTFADIKLRCVVDDITDCWEWKGCLNSSGTPICWFPATRKRVSLGKVICYLTTGREQPKGEVWHSRCGSLTCVNPKHRKQGTHSTKNAGTRTLLHTQKIIRTVRSNSEITEATAAEIRECSEPLRLIALKYGISASHAGRIRRGDNWRPIGIPGSSVFNLGG